MVKTPTQKKDTKGKGKAVEVPPAKEEVKKAKKPEKSKVRRIHVSGLPAITEAEVKDRFKSFGTVQKVDGLGKLDGNGNPLKYAFLDVDITKSKLAQCMNLLSGSVWKGSTLKIAEAKPTFTDRIVKERKDAAISADKPEAEKKSKKRKRAEGAESAEMSLVDKNNVKDREGWKLDPQSSTPLFPIVARPDHPLPPLPAGKKVEKVSKKKEKLSGKEKKKEKAATEPADPPTRAHRVKIDTTKWQPKHKRGKELSKGRVVAAPSQEEPSLDAEESLSDDESESHGSESESSDGSSSSKHFEQAAETAVEHVQDGINEDATVNERAAHMALMASVLGRVPERITTEEIPPVEAEHASSSSSEDEDAVVDGAEDIEMEDPAADLAAAAEEQIADEAAAEAELEEALDSAEEVDEANQTADFSVAEANTGQPTIQMQSLTEMFKPQETGAGFSLGNLLDEYDLEELPEPVAEPVQTVLPSRQPTYQAAPQASWLRTRAAFDPQEPLFFPFPFEEDEKIGGILYNIGESERNALLERSWTGLSEFKRFKRTQNMEEITAQYETAGKSLNEQVRKRHREAVKSRRRTGGKRDRNFAQDDL